MKKVLNKILMGLTIVFFGMTIIFIIISVVSVNTKKPPILFGYTISVVASESMEPDIKVGNILIGRKIAYSKLQIGDDIIYYSEKEERYIIHRITGIDEDGNFIASGINEKIGILFESVPEESYIAKAVNNINFLNLGRLVMNKGFIFVIIILLFIVILLNEGVNIYKTVQEKKTQENLEKIKKQKEEREAILRAEILAEIVNEQRENNAENQ